MPDTFAITIIFIVVSAAIAAFIRGRSKDKCLKNFNGNIVTVVATDGNIVMGNLNVESTGFELYYSKPDKKREGYIETSHIIYRNEYPSIQTIIRYHDLLDEKEQLRRNKELKKTYHPNCFRRMARKTRNLFSTIRDSVMEVVNLFAGKARQMNKMGSVLSSQDKYISRMKQDISGTISTSFEPLLEKHIGKKVVIEMIQGDKTVKYTGILKDYTPLFIEIMDVTSKKSDSDTPRIADLLIPRNLGRMRHLGE